MANEPIVTDAQVIDAEPAPETRAVVVAAPGPALAVTPQVQAGELVERLDVIKQAMNSAMQDGVDYGRIPGVDKPTLLKPGAEKLGVLFQLDIQPETRKTWGPGDHLTVECTATVYHAPTGARLGKGEGLCTTREKKYAKRRAELVCPGCGKENIRRSKQGDGFYCWAKTDGCGGNFAANDERITTQVAGEVDNPDLPDVWNTVIKMAEKRARVDAVLAVTGASAIFTQDAEDLPNGSGDSEQPATSAAPANAPSSSRPTARAPQPTARPATAKQRGLINSRAGDAGLSAAELGNAVLIAAGQAERTFESEEQAKQFVDRQLDRLPGRLVDAVLQEISNLADVKAAS